MAITVEMNGHNATIDGGQWTAAEPEIKQAADALTSDFWNGEVRYYPDIDRAIADFVVAQTGGKILQADDPGEPDPAVVY